MLFVFLLFGSSFNKNPPGENSEAFCVVANAVRHALGYVDDDETPDRHFGSSFQNQATKSDLFAEILS